MEDIILEFASCCRANGMRISTAEVLDCLKQLELAGSCAESVFHTILKANFAKSRREQAEFDRLYRLFFHEMKKGLVLPSPDQGSEGPVGADEPDDNDPLGLFKELANHLDGADTQTDLDQESGAHQGGSIRWFQIPCRLAG